MVRKLKVTLAHEYFQRIGKEIDYDETGESNLITLEQADLLQMILTSEISYAVLRKTPGTFMSAPSIQVDTMLKMRRILISEYEAQYEKYVEYNDFW